MVGTLYAQNYGTSFCYSVRKTEERNPGAVVRWVERVLFRKGTHKHPGDKIAGVSSAVFL